MLPAKPEVANAAGNASSQIDASGPGDSVYGASAPFAWFQVRFRNSALPPTPSDSAIGPPASDSGSAAGCAGLTGLAGFLAAPSSSASGGGAGGFSSFSAFSSSAGSPAGFLLGGAFSSIPLGSLLASSVSGADSGGGMPRSLSFDLDLDFDVCLAAGVLCFLLAFFFFFAASAFSETSSTSTATTNASVRDAVTAQRRSARPGWIGNRTTHTADPPSPILEKGTRLWAAGRKTFSARIRFST